MLVKNKKNLRPLVTFIVLGWNNKSLLKECFESILAQTYSNFIIIYVDNGSTDKSLEFVSANYPDIVIVNAVKNTGFAIGNNLGISLALKDSDCRYVALVNTDATLEKNWLETLIDFAESHPRCASLQTPTYDYYDHNTIDSFGIVVDHCGRAIQLGYRQSKPPPETRLVFGTNAAASLFTREFLDAQPFNSEYLDSDLWMYLEDVDIAARACVMGWNNWFVSKSGAYHMGSATSSKNPGFSVYMIYRNNFPMLIKNFPCSIIMRLLPGIFLTDIKTMAGLLRGRNRVALKALAKGRLHGIKLTFKMLGKRKQIRRTINRKDLWKLMST